MKAKVIFFDAAGTLIHLRKSVGENYAGVARTLGAELSPDALDAAFRSAWRNLPYRQPTGSPRSDDDKGWWKDLVIRMLACVPEIPPRFDRVKFFEEAYAHFARPEVWALYDDVSEVLPKLKPRYQLCVISNFDGRLRQILSGLGIADHFEDLYLSSELGADKPSPEIFREALRRSGVKANEAIHVGDDPERDWLAAEEAGLKVFRLIRGQNSLRDLPAAMI